jgi:hypothetical protein
VQKCRAHCQVHQVLRDINPLFIVSHQLTLSQQPSKGSLDYPAVWLNRKSMLSLQMQHNTDRKVPKCRLVHKAPMVIRRITEQVLYTRPTFFQRLKHSQGTCRVSYIRWRQIHRQQALLGTHGEMTLAPFDLLECVITPHFGRCCLDRLAVHDPSAGHRRPLGHHPVQHQCQTVKCFEHKPTHQTAKPVIHRLLWREVVRWHAPFTASPSQLAQGIEHLSQVSLARSNRIRPRRQQWLDQTPLLVFEAGRIASPLPGTNYLLLSASFLSRDHHCRTNQGIKRLRPHDLLPNF